MKLTDNWRVTGTDFSEFVDLVTKLASQTYVVPIRTDDIELLHYTGTEEVNGNEVMLYSQHSKKQIQKGHPLMMRLQSRNILRHGVKSDFLTEQKRSKLSLRMSGKGKQGMDLYFSSERLSRDLGARADLAGDAIYDPTDTRDAFLMERYTNHPKDIQAIVRWDAAAPNIHKVFALYSERGHYIDQRILLSMIRELESELGTAVCDAWEITHFLTRIWLSFPEKADDICGVYGLDDEFIPGVLLETSDTGDCSLRAIAYWTGRHHRARIGVYEREHRGAFEESAICENMCSKLMDKYVEFPARMCDLMDIEITDPDAGLEKMFRMLNVKKLIGKKRAANMLEYMQTEIRSMSTISAYELAMMMVELPNRFIGEAGLEDQLEELAGRAPYIDYEEVAKATSSVVLV